MEERSASEAATEAGSVAEGEVTAAASVGVEEEGEEVAAAAVEACSVAGVGVAAAGVSGVEAAASAGEASLLSLLPPQPQSDSDLDDETPPRTIGAAAAYRGRSGDEDVVSLPSTCRSEVPNWRPWLSFEPERFTNRFGACLQAPCEGRERTIPLLGSIARHLTGGFTNRWHIDGLYWGTAQTTSILDCPQLLWLLLLLLAWKKCPTARNRVVIHVCLTE